MLGPSLTPEQVSVSEEHVARERRGARRRLHHHIYITNNEGGLRLFVLRNLSGRSSSHSLMVPERLGKT